MYVNEKEASNFIIFSIFNCITKLTLTLSFFLNTDMNIFVTLRCICILFSELEL